MMIRFLLFLMVFIASSRGQAQYARVVRPPEIRALVSFIQFEMQTALEQFYKEGFSVVRETSSSIRLRTYVCGAVENGTTEARVQVRRNVRPSGAETLVVEELLVQRCAATVVVARAVRQGLGIAPTDDARLLRGLLPTDEGARIYDLTLSDSSIVINRVRELSRETLNIKIGPSAVDDEYLRLEFTETREVDSSERYSLKIRAFAKDRSVNEVWLDYVWRARNGVHEVPRQYLYLNGGEIAPDVYSGQLASYLSKGVYAWIGTAFKRVLAPVD